MERFGKYLLLKELGRGATANVYLARREDSDQTVSLKVFHPSLASDPNFLRRAQREMKLTAALKHPQIVSVHEVISDTNPPALALHYVDGENLQSFQSRLPYVLPEVSLLIGIEILKALEYSHSQGVIHRDLKPENVLVSKDGKVFVTDFGLAKLHSMRTSITQADALVGSIDYMSPEQATGDSVSPQSDLFSLAAILYFLVTGTKPFVGSSAMSTLALIKSAEIESPQKRNPKISSQLSQIIGKGLSLKPQDRYASATEFRETLEKYLESCALTPDQFNLTDWVQEPAGYTLESLTIAAHKLVETAEKDLTRRDWNKFLLSLAHLGLKAPQHPALARLTLEYRNRKGQNRKTRWIVASAVCGLLIVAALVPLFRGSHGKEIRASVEISTSPQPMPSVSPSPAPAQKQPPVKQTPRKKVLIAPPPPKAAAKPQEPTEEIKTGKVLFSVPPEVTVFWDGKRIDPRIPLFNQRVGWHRITMDRKGYDAIHTSVEVKADEDTVVSVK